LCEDILKNSIEKRDAKSDQIYMNRKSKGRFKVIILMPVSYLNCLSIGEKLGELDECIYRIYQYGERK
jgi:hypothetical protein